MVEKLFDKKTPGGPVKNEIMQNRELAEELQKKSLENLKN